MNVDVRFATIWFSLALTKPGSPRFPVALVCTGHAPESDFCLVGTIRHVLEVDPDAAQLLAWFPSALDALVERGLRETEPARLLEWLAARLRHSFALGDVQEACIAVRTGPPTTESVLSALLPICEIAPAADSQPTLTAIRFDTINART